MFAERRRVVSLLRGVAARARFFVLMGVLFCAPVAVANALETRLWATAANTRLVLESDALLSYSVSGLQDPPRLVIDVSYRKNNLDALKTVDITAAGDYITAVRHARLDGDTVRIVFDLVAAVNYNVNAIKPIANYRHRLVLDIKPQETVDPLLALIEKLDALESDPFVVLIDPGHGGEDPGAVSPNNNYEKNVILQICRRLREEINRRPGMRALLTREDDRFIPLFERVRIAHRLRADVFISVHADSVKSRTANGASVFILSKKGASSRFAKQLARGENLSDLVGGTSASAASDPTLDIALREFSRDGKERASRLLAESVLKKVGEIQKLHKPRVESAGFAVLKSPSIPSLLLETAFISNSIDEKKLLDEGFQQRMAVAVASAIQEYRDQYHVNE